MTPRIASQELNPAATAIRDYEYIAGLEDSQQTTSQYSRLWEAHGWDVFFWIKYGDINFKAYTERRTSTSDPLREWLKRGLPKSWAYSKEEMARRLDEYTHNAVAREVSPFVDKLARFVVAITGGLSLVLPMLVMRLNQNETKSLITTSVAVLIFSALVSIVFKATNAETLGITAAYAAVLVVFVGASA